MQDLGFIFKNRKRIRSIFGSESLSPAFRERMMLAVTQVNDCRYCARFHTKAALAEGISREEVNAILEGAFKDCPSDQLAGVLYAEHWAEMLGAPDAEVRDKLIAAYGQDMANDIDIILRIIKTGCACAVPAGLLISAMRKRSRLFVHFARLGILLLCVCGGGARAFSGSFTTLCFFRRTPLYAK